MSLGLGLGLALTRDSGGIIVPPALAGWYARVLAAGGIVLQSDLNAVNALLDAYTAAGLADATCRLNPYCGRNLAAALVPVLRGGGPDTDTNINFVSGDYGVATGLTGDGATKSINTSRSISALVQTASAHQGVYSLNGAVMPGAVCGGYTNSSGQAILDVNTTSVGMKAQMWAGTGAPVVGSPAVGICTRFVLGNRPAAADTRLYSDGVERATGTPGGTPPSREMHVHAVLTNGGLVTGWTARPLGGYSFGRLIPTASIPAVSAAWKTYSDAMGRII